VVGSGIAMATTAFPAHLVTQPGFTLDRDTPGPRNGRCSRGMAEMLKDGVNMDVVNAEQDRIAEDAGPWP
jgi:hypothetical protein